MLIAPGKLTDFCPLYNSDGRPENTISQFDKKDVENVGLVKLSGIKKRLPIYYTAGFLVLLGLLPKFGALAQIIPSPQYLVVLC